MINLLFGTLFTALCILACSQSSPMAPASPYQNPTPGSDTDYAIQGEYLGANAATGVAKGAQVIAQGQGVFQLLLLDGGLPGQGWNGNGRKILSGNRQQSVAAFVQSNFHLSIKVTGSSTAVTGDSLTGTNDLGQTLRLVKVHRQSPSLKQIPPSGAVVLFDGTSVDSWTNAVLDLTGTFHVNTGSSGAISLRSFADFTLHLEFQLPFEPGSSGQDRGNSGVYLQERYELQILDSFGQSLPDLFAADTLGPKRQCGAFYEQSAPIVNMAFPPLTWQTYDVTFTAARWDAARNKIQNAKVTVRQNGVVVHQDRVLVNSTLLGLGEYNTPGPLLLQYHGHAVLFRNIWIVPN